jgi:hypothetical protein
VPLFWGAGFYRKKQQLPRKMRWKSGLPQSTADKNAILNRKQANSNILCAADFRVWQSCFGYQERIDAAYDIELVLPDQGCGLCRYFALVLGKDITFSYKCKCLHVA